MATNDKVIICFFSVFLLISCSVSAVFKGPYDVEGFDIEFDWRDHGVITPVINAGVKGNPMCIDKKQALESMNAIAHGKLIPLSFGQAEDCCPKYVTNFDCIKKNGGLCSWADYTKAKGYCKPANCTLYGQIAKTYTLPAHNETLMEHVVRTIGPPLATLHVDLVGRGFLGYHYGLYQDHAACDNKTWNYQVQIVGFGTQNGTGKKFWLIRNTFGPDWGYGGYMYFERGTNLCGISNDVFLPILSG